MNRVASRRLPLAAGKPACRRELVGLRELSVPSANSSACAFYRSFGFAPGGHAKTDARFGFRFTSFASVPT